MARKIRDSRLEARSSRLKLPVRRKPYPGPSLARGISLLYRRNRGNGSWVTKVSDGHGSYWTKAFAEADDYENSDGKRVLDFYQAQDAAKKLARGDETADSVPITIDRALKDYETDLEARNANIYRNAIWPRRHLTATLLAKPVQLLTSKELKSWRDNLLTKIKPASINRLCNVVCAALELAAQHDKRIKNRDAWEIGLAGLPNAQTDRNVVLSDDKVRAFIAAAYACNDQLGLLIEVLAVTGARPSQAIRLCCDDLQDHPVNPKLRMPKSGKGGGRNRSERKVKRYSVPITPALAVKLKEVAGNRSGEMLLLLRSDGSPWQSENPQYRDNVREIVKSIGLDPNEVTPYALRHSSIVRLLLRNVPIRLVASLHDTSVGQIESNYSKHITEHSDSDDHARAALLDLEPVPPPADNVVSLVR
jgi:integrase